MFGIGGGWELVSVAGGRPSIAPGPPFGPGRPPRKISFERRLVAMTEPDKVRVAVGAEGLEPPTSSL